MSVVFCVIFGGKVAYNSQVLFDVTMHTGSGDEVGYISSFIFYSIKMEPENN